MQMITPLQCRLLELHLQLKTSETGMIILNAASGVEVLWCVLFRIPTTILQN